MTTISIEVQLPEGVMFSSYHRLEKGHGLEVTWDLPQRVTCQHCRREDQARIEYRNSMQVVRDLYLFEEPSFWIYQPAFHRCAYCGHRQTLIPPFKRKDTSYTYRFEEYILRQLIGSNQEEVARRHGISAEMVGLIVDNQLQQAKQKEIDPERVITDIGIDELSLKKRHRLYVTLVTDLSDPLHPQILAVAQGKDEAAGRACLEKLSQQQRQQIKTYRADMGAPFHAACRGLLPNARAVVDRFHVAKKFSEAVDRERKKNREGIQGQADEKGTPGVSHADVGISPSP